MSESQVSLGAAVEELDAKADDYEEVENYETKKQQYLSSLSSIESSIGRLKRRIIQMEFLVGVLTEVHDEELPVGGEVAGARDNARSVLNRNEDEFYELATDGREDQYEQKIQQAISNVSSAHNAVEDKLREVQTEWEENVETARNVQKLVGESREVSRTLDDVEKFVNRKMWDDSKEVHTLASEWNGLQQKLKGADVDWDTFQEEHDLNDATKNVLKKLASEGEIELDELDETVATEMLSVGPLRDVITLSI